MASAVFRTKLHHLLTYKGMPKLMQYGARSILLVPLVCVLRLLKKNKKNKKKTKRGRNRGCSLHVSAPSLGSKVSYMLCSIPAFSWQALFVGFWSYSGVAQLFVCTTAYKEPLPSLHRQHYLAVWYIRTDTGRGSIHNKSESCHVFHVITYRTPCCKTRELRAFVLLNATMIPP